MRACIPAAELAAESDQEDIDKIVIPGAVHARVGEVLKVGDQTAGSGMVFVGLVLYPQVKPHICTARIL